MSRFLLLTLILADALMILAMATDTVVQTTEEPMVSSSSKLAEAPIIPQVEVGNKPSNLSSSEGINVEASSLDDLPENQESEIAQAPGGRRLGRHHSIDKSIAGGGVILGGLATTFFVSVFCYIRATRRRSGETVG